MGDRTIGQTSINGVDDEMMGFAVLRLAREYYSPRLEIWI